MTRGKPFNPKTLARPRRSNGNATVKTNGKDQTMQTTTASKTRKQTSTKTSKQAEPTTTSVAGRRPKTPLCKQHAASLRKYPAQRIASTLGRIAKWIPGQHEDIDAATEALRTALDAVNAAVTHLDNVPDDLRPRTARNGGARSQLQVGDIVAVKPKFVEAYADIFGADMLDEMVVDVVGKERIKVLMADGEKGGMRRNELKFVRPGDQAADDADDDLADACDDLGDDFEDDDGLDDDGLN